MANPRLHQLAVTQPQVVQNKKTFLPVGAKLLARMSEPTSALTKRFQCPSEFWPIRYSASLVKVPVRTYTPQCRCRSLILHGRQKLL